MSEPLPSTTPPSLSFEAFALGRLNPSSGSRPTMRVSTAHCVAALRMMLASCTERSERGVPLRPPLVRSVSTSS